MTIIILAKAVFILKITVAGAGRWGSCIAWYLDRKGHDVTVYGLKDAPQMIELYTKHTNGIVTMPESVKYSFDLETLKDSDVIVISIPSQVLTSFMKGLEKLELKNKIFVLCMKGIEIETGKRLSQIVTENCDKSCKVAVWIGPGHVQEFTKGIPNCMVIDSEDEDVKHLLVNEFTSDLIRFYYGSDLIGNEIGAAAKNVIGIAAGMLDALNLTTLKGPLMSRGTYEISKLIEKAGGNGLSAYGLCHLGDYQATVFSQFSHNRHFGEAFLKGEKFESLAEGYYTVKALMNMSEKLGVELPICRAVYDILYNNADPKEVLDRLFSRTVKNEL